MPELPEVETVRATLEHQILNFKIIDVKVLCPRIVSGDIDSFRNKLIGKKICKLQRYGKYLIFVFDDCSMISHLRMEGKYFLKDQNDEIIKHEHVIFYFDNGLTLRYHDTRKFGIMRIVNKTDFNEIMKEPELKKLGPEANHPIDVDLFYQKIHKLHKPIKEILLDQTIICGLGNIYVDEVLFLSRINPVSSASLITKYEASLILKNSEEVLGLAVKAGGTTIRSYTSSLGVTGRFQLNLNVHTKVDEPCPNCNTLIKKTRVGGRGTYYCPNCQKIHPLIIGITGSISTGKSTISNKLIELGYQVIDTDKIANELTKDRKILENIKDLFGSEYINNNELDRKKLGQLIFKNIEERNKLNNFLHPLIKERTIKEIRNSDNHLIFIDVPLLFESKFNELCNYNICVSTSLSNQIERLMKRDHINKEEALIKINSQMNLKKKEKLSDFIIDNSQDLCYTYTQLQNIISKLEGE